MAAVIIDYEDVADIESNLNDQILKAFGPDGLGLICIKGVPGFLQAKLGLLEKGHQLSHSDKQVLDSLEDEKSLYNAGWSFGKEKLGDGVDTSKGSFYFNPVTDVPGTEEDRERFPCSYPCNIWPKQIDAFENNAKRLGLLLRDICGKVGGHIDKYAQAQNGCSLELGTNMSNTEKVKGRLLYYYPRASTNSWIGWHNDSGYLTGLAGDIYVDDATGERVECPDPQGAGLYVVGRKGEEIRVEIPFDCMAVQLGECVQILTGGALQATPHCVRGGKCFDKNVARVSCACFVDMPPTQKLLMPKSCTREQVLGRQLGGDALVPPLGERWTEDGMEFGAFLEKTFAKYYS
mmetsp:Transcript_17708/g.30084  ORF Transcript_17708/g.30084 Transcript_17708/m.30084 type:complete len:348 (-) Transcript_17708:624-1667(-)